MSLTAADDKNACNEGFPHGEHIWRCRAEFDLMLRVLRVEIGLFLCRLFLLGWERAR